MILATVIYYVLSSSVFLFYGIGINNLISMNKDYGSQLLTGVKSLITVTTSTAVSYLLINAILTPVHLAELYPFVAVIVFVTFSAIVEVFVSIGIQNSITEFGIPMLSMLLALNESTSLAHAIVIATACVLAFYALFAIVYSLRSRFDVFAPATGLRVYSLLFVSLAVITIVLFAFSASWLASIGGAD